MNPEAKRFLNLVQRASGMPRLSPAVQRAAGSNHVTSFHIARHGGCSSHSCSASRHQPVKSAAK